MDRSQLTLYGATVRLPCSVGRKQPLGWVLCSGCPFSFIGPDRAKGVPVVAKSPTIRVDVVLKTIMFPWSQVGEACGKFDVSARTD